MDDRNLAPADFLQVRRTGRIQVSQVANLVPFPRPRGVQDFLHQHDVLELTFSFSSCLLWMHGPADADPGNCGISSILGSCEISRVNIRILARHTFGA